MIIDQLFKDTSKKNLNEVDPRNFDSDEDFYAAQNAPAKPRYRGQQSRGVNPDDEAYFREIFRKKREAAKKAEQDKDQGVAEEQVYESFYKVGRMLSERKMSEEEILDVFAQAEKDMTNTATGANRTALGRGKDVVGRGITNVKDAVGSVLNSIQNSAPVAGVDVAYDQATDALANIAGGQNSKIMDTIKKYRLLAKEYPKTQLFVKTALIALAGLATGGAGLPAIAGLTAAVDSAIKGEKLSSLIGKGAGAALMGLGAQKVNAMLHSTSSGDEFDPGTGDNWGTSTPDATGGDPSGIAGQFAGGQYTIQNGDQLGYIAQANGVSAEDIKSLNPHIEWEKPLQPGMKIDLPPTGDGTGSVWQGYTGGVYGDKAAMSQAQADALSSRADNLANMQTQAGTKASALTAQPFGSGPPDTSLLGGRTGRYVKESVQFKTLPADQMIDQKLTVLTWALNESVSRKSNTIHLTTKGVYTVFENIDRCRKAVIKEAAGPGRAELPDYYRPDMPGAPAPQTAQPGAIGRGLNWMDKAAKKVGGAVSDFGRQFTTGVTKEKLKMNWHQAGKPTDSDQLAAFLGQQKVPPQVITDIFGKMGIPYNGVEVPIATGAINPATGKAYTPSEMNAAYDALMAKKQAQYAANVAATTRADPAGIANKMISNTSTTDLDTAVSDAQAALADKQQNQYASNVANSVKNNISGMANKMVSKPAQGAPSAANPAGWDNPQSPAYVGRREVARRQAAQPAAPAQAKPSYAGPGGYGKTTMTATGINPTHNYDEVTGKITPFGAIRVPARQAAQAAYNAEQDALDAKKLAAGKPTTAKLPASGGAGVKAAAQPGQLSKDEYIRRIGADAMPESRVFNALKKPVSEMLSMVETKEDVTKIKQFIDQTFVKYGAVSESAFVVRNKLIEHVTQVGAQRRREHARKS